MAYEYVDSLKGFFSKKNGKVKEKQMKWTGSPVNNPGRPDHTGRSFLYSGEIKNYRPHGYGEFSEKSGSGFPDFGYKGNWNNGVIEGEGVFFANPEGENNFRIVYEGFFKNNNFNGFGKFQTSYIPRTSTVFKPIHILYEGDWIDGKRNGSGIQIWKHHENIKINELIVQTESTYDGGWADDKFSGTGKLTSIFGWVYEGEFQNGKRHGYGKLVSRNGEIIEGLWDKDSLKSN